MGIDEITSLLDELAANAWPAVVQQGIEGWRLRAADGVTRRANSVLSIGPAPRYDGWIEDVERFYGRCGLPARFQVSPASPTELDGFLSERGYRFDAETSVMIATTDTVCERARYALPFGLGVQASVTDRWLDAFMSIEKYGEDRRPGYEDILRGIGPASCFVLVSDGAEDVGLGMAVAERGWAGIFCVATDEQHRRQGVARQVMSALADWSREAGERNLYLQVVANNVPAVTLYSRLGFSHLYYYHYREK